MSLEPNDLPTSQINDLCGMVQALQLEEHDHPTYIPVPLSSIHLGVRVVNFTAQVEVTQKFVNKETKPDIVGTPLPRLWV